jgi:hypothetical protein
MKPHRIQRAWIQRQPPPIWRTSARRRRIAHVAACVGRQAAIAHRVYHPVSTTANTSARSSRRAKLVEIYRIQDGVTGFYADDSSILFPLTDQERAFGDYTPGRFAWLLANVKALPEPIPAKGALGLWNYEGAL